MNIVLWNTEWADPDSPAGKYIREFAKSKQPSIICYTEVLEGLHPEGGHLIESSPDYGYERTEGKRKVSLWSAEPWEEVDTVGDESIPTGRFVSGVSHDIRFVGVCIPWKDAHVRSGRKDRSAWEDHITYLKGLKKIVSRYSEQKHPVCILGDYNQRIPRKYQPEHVLQLLNDIIGEGFNTETSRIHDSEDKQLIDHISASPELKISVSEIHPKVTSNGIELSDHVGIVAELDKANKEETKETVESRIFQCYSNLAMAHAAVSESAKTYTKKHFMIRGRLGKGLRNRTMKIGSLFDDEKEKMSNQSCCYCGSTIRLSIEHLLARKHGGTDSGDNLVLACQSCNSAKNKKDMLDWHLDRGVFPPLSVFRRYLKILHQYCERNSLLHLDLASAKVTLIPFSVSRLPVKFPQPEFLEFHPKTKVEQVSGGNG